MEAERLAARHIVLLGIGHTNAHIVRMWRMNPIPDTDLTCISDNAIATYSGMLPAALAGQIRPDEMEIDLVQLCSSVGARLVIDRASGIDLRRHQVMFSDRPPIPFDLLSIGIGSVPTTGGVAISGDSLIQIKPMQSFRTRLAEKVRSILSNLPDPQPIQIVVVGSGVAGIEITLCISPFLRELGAENHRICVVSRSDQILPGACTGTRKRVLAELAGRGFELVSGHAVVKVSERSVELDDGRTLDADLVLWATGASPPNDLKRFELPLHTSGFLATDHTLRSTSGEPVFAVGDSGTIVGEELPKAGVYAVRQGPVLWKNMQRYLRNQALERFRPQRSFLKLINFGNGKAVGEWKGISFGGAWAYWLKHRIDSKFIEKFRPLKMAAGDQPMQCRGCGCKLGSAALDAALGLSASIEDSGTGTEFTPGNRPRIELEDAAEIGGGTQRLLASTDFFSNPFDDAFWQVECRRSIQPATS
jgi:selenide,water dikinase